MVFSVRSSAFRDASTPNIGYGANVAQALDLITQKVGLSDDISASELCYAET